MKKNIFLILFAFIGFAFTADAQSCCSSKAKSTSSCANKTATASKACCAKSTVETTKACCAKKTSATAEATTTTTKAVLVSNEVEHNETAKFTVYGNCGMCKKTIEGALKDVKGVISGVWDRETDMMTVTFNPHKIELDTIKQKIADVGYDSDTHRAKDEVYNNLPGCCQYERPKS